MQRRGHFLEFPLAAIADFSIGSKASEIAALKSDIAGLCFLPQPENSRTPAVYEHADPDSRRAFFKFLLYRLFLPVLTLLRLFYFYFGSRASFSRSASDSEVWLKDQPLLFLFTVFRAHAHARGCICTCIFSTMAMTNRIKHRETRDFVMQPFADNFKYGSSRNRANPICTARPRHFLINGFAASFGGDISMMKTDDCHSGVGRNFRRQIIA